MEEAKETVIKYRKARPDEREAYIDLANLVFNLTYGFHNFERHLPKVYDKSVESSSMQRIAVDEKGRIRALIALMPGEASVSAAIPCGRAISERCASTPMNAAKAI